MLLMKLLRWIFIRLKFPLEIFRDRITKSNVNSSELFKYARNSVREECETHCNYYHENPFRSLQLQNHLLMIASIDALIQKLFFLKFYLFDLTSLYASTKGNAI